MKKSTIALLSIGAVCIVAGGWYAIQNMSSTSQDQGLFATQSVRSQCINNEQEYISCRKEGFSEKFCLIKQSKNRETGTSCLSKIPDYSKPVDYTTPVEDEHEIYTDRVTIMLSEKNTERKTIITDYNNAEQSAEEYTTNGLREETTPYKKELMDYLNIALDAYGIKEMQNNSSYFATRDEKINPNIIYIVFNKETDVGTFIAELQSKIDQTIEVLPEYKRTLYGTPNDPQANNLWHLKGGNGVHAYRAWDQLAERKLNYVKVGIVDDGFYVSHEDLSITSAVPAGAGGGHGTHIAGLVGALTNNGKGVPSAARNVGNIQIKGYNYHFGEGDNDGSSNIMGLVQQAVQDGAKVINMSRGGGGYSSAEAQIFQSAYNMGVVLIAAAGNEYGSQPGYPARYPGVISVSASDLNGNKAGFSNAGGDLLSPGVNIKSTCIGGGYCEHSGTSMASPLAVSVAALLLSLQPSLSPDEIENILKSTTNPKGVINACNAVAQLLGNDPAVVCDDKNIGGDLGESCLGDTQCKSGVCEEIIEAKCVSGKYGEKIACKGFTTEEQCLGFKQDVGIGTGAGGNSGGGTNAGDDPNSGTTVGGSSAGGTSAGNGGGNLVSVCEWEETVVGGTCVGNCGNGVLEGINGNNEQCDDGNNINGDGCDSMCKKEGCTSDSECSEGYCNGYLSSGCYPTGKGGSDSNPVGSNTGGGSSEGGDSDADGDENGTDCQSLEKDICRTTNNCLWFDERKGTCKVPMCGDSIIDPGEECELQKSNPGGGEIPPNGDIEGNGGVVGSTWECIECKKVYQDTLCEQMKNNKAAFDYNNDGLLNQSDVKILQDVILGILPLSPTLDGKTGDLNKDNKLTAADIMLYNRQLQDCLKSICGNGTKEGTEQCDDGNQNNGDGCNNICEIEKKTLPTCGNNIIEAPEQCDGSDCAKGQTCTPAGSKNACTCQTEIIKEPIPTTPPTRDGGKMDR